MISWRTRWAVALFPPAFFAVNRTWMYSTTDNVDAWKCAGYFVHPDLLYRLYPGAYQGSRVLHNAIGWLAHAELPVAAAIFAHKAALFYAGFLFLFGALRALFRNERAALAGAALGMTNGLAIFNLSWNYVLGTCLVLMLGAAWAMARTRDARRPWAWQMLAGAMFTGAVCTYLAQAALAPVMAALFFFCLPRWTWRELAKGLAWAATGAAAVMILQAMISAGFGGPWEFWRQQVIAGQRYAATPLDYVPFELWWRDAVWLPFYLALLVLAGAAIGKAWQGGEEETEDEVLAPLTAVAVLYGLGFGIFWFLSAAGVRGLLQNEAQASMLLAPAFLVMGGWLAWLLEGMTERRQWLVAGVALGGILIVWGVPEGPPRLWALGLAAVAVLAGLAGAGATPRRKLGAAVTLAAALAGLNFYLADREQRDPGRLEASRAQNEAVYGAVELLDEWGAQGQVWLWIARDAADGWLQMRLADFYLYGSCLVGEKFPGLNNGLEGPEAAYARRPARLEAGMRVVTFDAQPGDVLAAEIAVAARGLRLTPVAQRDTPARGTTPVMRMSLWDAVPIARTHGTRVDTAGAAVAAGAEQSAVSGGERVRYAAGTAEPVWKLRLPDDFRVQPKEGPRWMEVRIGGNERPLWLILTNAQGKVLAETTVDAGAAVRQAWLQLQPDTEYRYLRAQPKQRGTAGSFVVEGAEY